MQAPLVFVLAGIMAFPVGAQVSSTPSVLKVVNLKPPEYPPIAKAARVFGRVELKLKLRNDGTVEDVQVKSGPAMLRDAAVLSAKGSRFEPLQASDPNATYDLAYKFVLEELDCDQSPNASYPRAKYDSNTITVTG